MHFAKIVLTNLAIVLFFAITAFADGTQLGEINGRVIDKSGAPLPGATVEVVNTEKGTRRVTTTDAQGRYKIPLLQPGPYRVKISLQGFDTFVAQNAIVEVEK